MSKHKEVSHEEFSNEILRWIGQDVYPLEVITLTKHFDDHMPTIKKFAPEASEDTLLILSGSYTTRAAALTLIGELWDKAIKA